MKTALVTGASAGLGKELSLELARKKFSLVLIGQNLDRLNQVKKQALELGSPRVETVSIDLSQTQELESSFSKLATDLKAQGFSNIDVVLCNAGLRITGKTEEVNAAKLQSLFAVNYFSPVLLTKALLPMVPAGGHFMFVSSGAALYGVPEDGAYCASKAALDRFTEALALEVQSKNIKVTSISPGPMETELYRKSPTFNSSPVKTPKAAAASPEVRAKSIVASIGQDKRKLNLTPNPLIIRILALFAPSVLEMLIKKKT